MLAGIQPPPNCFANEPRHRQLYSRCAGESFDNIYSLQNIAGSTEEGDNHWTVLFELLSQCPCSCRTAVSVLYHFPAHHCLCSMQIGAVLVTSCTVAMLSRIRHVVASTPVMAHETHIVPHPAATAGRFFLD